MRLSDVIVVLSRPAEAGNVGAACRAIKNMGLSRLRLVAPEFSNEPAAAITAATLTESGFAYGGIEAVIRARAVHAADIWEKAETFDSLHSAVKDCTLVIGTSHRRGRRRKPTMPPAELALFLKSHPGPAALVFGNERTGLDAQEIEVCNLASHIPANKEFPSLNLSHAVMIYAYELFKILENQDGRTETVSGQWLPLGQEALHFVARELTDNLKLFGFYKQTGSENHEHFFRDIFSRAALTEKEADYFKSIITKTARLASS